MNINDVIALTEDLPEKGLKKGQVGTLVEMLDKHNFEVEFSDNQGKVYAQVPIEDSKMMLLSYEALV